MSCQSSLQSPPPSTHTHTHTQRGGGGGEEEKNRNKCMCVVVVVVVVVVVAVVCFVLFFPGKKFSSLCDSVVVFFYVLTSFGLHV